MNIIGVTGYSGTGKSTVNKNKQTRLTDDDVRDMLDGKVSNYFLREGLCGKDISEWDLSGLSPEYFKRLCFDSKTIFSEEQNDKFHPKELIEKSKILSQDLSRLHKLGVTGQNLRIAVIDTNIDTEHEIFSNGNIQMKTSSNIGKLEVHGLTVVSALSQIVPDAKINYYPYDKTDKNKDSIREDIIDEIIKSGVKIISMSSSFNSEDIRKRVLQKCEKAGVTLIDQPNFVKHFTYCFRDLAENGEEIFEEAFMESEDAIINSVTVSKSDWEKYKKIYESKLKEYNVDNIDSLLEKVDDEHLRKGLELFRDIITCETYEGENGVRHIAKQKRIQEERDKKAVSRDKKLVEIACGGRCFASPNGYKYWGTCSNSYSIPQIAGVFALAKQISSDLSFEQFSQIANETAMQIDDRLIIMPEQLIEQVKKLEVQRKQNSEIVSYFHDQKSEFVLEQINSGKESLGSTSQVINKNDITPIAKSDGVDMENENAQKVLNELERTPEEIVEKNL